MSLDNYKTDIVKRRGSEKCHIDLAMGGRGGVDKRWLVGILQHI